MDYDVLVVGGGIAGMESSLKLGDMGYKVLLVEKESSVGGRMILLSKVFPTLDCASCISGPKMSSTINHPNITTKSSSEVLGIQRNGNGGFKATVRSKAIFVDPAICTGCQDCEPVCTVAVPDQFNADLVPRRAAYLAFPQAVPKKVVIERVGTSPCTDTCPAGIKAHGYVSLIRNGQYEEAFQLVLDATPLVGTLGRACYAPCESECTRGELEGTIPIRRLKRFVADRHYGEMKGSGLAIPEPNGKSVAIVGSGPSGLTAAWQLARAGYAVKIFESAPHPGGFLRYAIPAYRLPQEVVEQDIRNVTELGVEIVTNTPVRDLEFLKSDGYDAILVATGTPSSTALDIPGEHLEGVHGGLEFLRSVRQNHVPDYSNKRVIVVGGGNVAMDAARTAQRLGAVETVVAYRRGREEMPAHIAEVEDAEKESVKFEFLVSPVEVIGDESGHVTGLRCQRMKLGQPDSSGRRSSEPVPGSDFVIACDEVIAAIGMAPETAAFDRMMSVGTNHRIQVNPKTLQSDIPYLFASGDVVNGATDITRAVGEGRRAAHMIDRWLQGRPLDGFQALDDRLAVVNKADVLARQKKYSHRDPVTIENTFSSAPRDFSEIERALTEEESLAGAGGCLDCGVCSECGQCVAACPAQAIDLNKHERVVQEIEVGAVVVSTGYKLFAADLKPEYGWGKYPNVITGMQMDRLLAPTRPYNTVLRPSDGKVPDRLAFVSCTGSRDKTVGNPLCSKICCMYSIKQNQLIMGTLPLADVTMHYIDIRAAGKRYDEFYEQSKDMGAAYIKGRVAKITEKENGNLILHYEDIENGGQLVDAEYDLVVLAVGVQPNRDAANLFTEEELELDEYFYVAEPNDDLNPGQTNIPGVFVAGAASGAKDIVDSITHAGAAVSQVAAYLETHQDAHVLTPAKIAMEVLA
ncbi:NADPH-Fe(3+) oxidoreductase subunit beta [mine drainage metagenome]|uniref:NADPH-Fe(3+) oxidoreductase subunit beta n=1 Tax=mine drainage metagenome TaxID=410659 RepID=A0A1J5QLF6_9ZZZZ